MQTADRQLQPRALPYVLALALLLGGLYGLTASKLRFGYEGGNIDQAEAILRGQTQPRAIGGIEPYTQGGLIEVAAYMPFTVGKLALERRGMLLGMRQLAYVFAIPIYTVLLCLIFFGLARELYGSPRVAAGLAALLGTATMVWPYAKFGMETQQTLWTLVAIWALARYARRPGAGPAVAFGLALAALMLTKISGPLQAAALAVAALWIFARGGLWRRTRAGSHLMSALLLGLGGVILFLTSNQWRYGGWVWQGRYGMGFETTPYPLWQALWAVVASPGESLLLFSPPLLVGLWFWGAFWRRFPAMRPVFVVMLAVGVAQLHNRPWADETWGPRRLHYLVPLLALPLGMWLERIGSLRPLTRLAGLAVVAFGLWVQLMAIAFDYTAEAKVLGWTPVFAQENTVWDPQLCPLRFNLHLLDSWKQKIEGGASLPFVYERHYLPWTAPASPPPPERFDLKGEDRLDFWFLQQRTEWADRPYWFVSPSSFLVPIFAFMLLVGELWLAWLVSRAFRSRKPVPGPAEEKP